MFANRHLTSAQTHFALALSQIGPIMDGLFENAEVAGRIIGFWLGMPSSRLEMKSLLDTDGLPNCTTSH
jgi:hypothetical protein